MSMQDQVVGESRTNMIYEMERKLNAGWFTRRLRKNDSFSTLSTTQYWDWLTYIDVRTLTDMTLAGRLSYRVRGFKDEGALLLTASGTEWSGSCSHFIRLARDFPAYGTNCEILCSRMATQIPCHYHNRYLYECIGIKLAETQ